MTVSPQLCTQAFLDVRRLTVLILAGGSGTRLWPLSTRTRPKQFVALVHPEKTMLQMTWERIPEYVPRDKVFVNVACGFESLALAQLSELDPDNLIVAPEERSTLPIAGYASACIERRIPGATVLVMSADNFIGDTTLFHDALHDCFVAAQAGPYLVALGVEPTHASTQYGYMTVGRRMPLGRSIHQGGAYLEKPSADVAQRLLAEGCHDWNAGAFAWNVDVFFDACRAHAPAHHAVFDRMRQPRVVDDPVRLASLFAQLPQQDLDRGVMERLEACDSAAPDGPRLLVVRGRFDWDDIGTFVSLHARLPKDGHGNAVAGAVRTGGDVRRCTLVCEAPFSLHVHGLTDALVVVSALGEVLVCARDSIAALSGLRQQGFRCGLTPHADGRATLKPAGAPGAAHAFARLSEAPGAAVFSDGPGGVSVLGVARCRVQVQDGEVTVSVVAAAVAEAPCPEPAWLTIDEDHEAMSLRAAQSLVTDLRELIALRERPVVVLSAGQTPVRLYELLRTRHALAIDWRRIVMFQMDEYVAPWPGGGLSFHRFLQRALVGPLGVTARFLTGDESAAELQAYEASIDALGGIDLVLHGIGTNGHLGFNEPGSDFGSLARRVTLAPSSRPASQTGPAARDAVTLGLHQLTAARRVRLIASGRTKRDAVRQALLGPADTSCPASSLQGHPDLKVFIDRDACDWIGCRHG